MTKITEIKSVKLQESEKNESSSFQSYFSSLIKKNVFFFISTAGPVLDNDLQTSPRSQKDLTIRFILAYVSDDFMTKKNVQRKFFFSIFFFRIKKYFRAYVSDDLRTNFFFQEKKSSPPIKELKKIYFDKKKFKKISNIFSKKRFS